MTWCYNWTQNTFNPSCVSS